MATLKKIECVDPGGKHEMAYTEWGDPQNEKVLICVHGLSRNGQDFQDLAKVLQSEYRVICPDVVGRGESDWLTNPSDYGIPLYVRDLLTLIQSLNSRDIYWLGTSMGGMIGMIIASQENSPIQRLILNDIGLLVTVESLQRIVEYLSQSPPNFKDFGQVEEYVKKTYSGFGKLTDQQWKCLANASVKLTPEGVYQFHYDPAIVTPFKGEMAELKPIDLGGFFALIRCPILLLHGEESDILSQEIIAQMQLIQKTMNVKHWSDCGHAPALMSTEQIEFIRTWLKGSRCS